MKHWGHEDEHGTSRAYGWMAAESIRGSDQKHLWRHGRAHLQIRGAGRRRFYEARPGDRLSRQIDWGKRSDLGFNASWYLLPPKHSSFGVGASFKWGTNASETTPDLSLYAGRLGSLWLQFENVIPYRWLERWVEVNPTKPGGYPVWTAELAAEGRHGLFSYIRPGKTGAWRPDYDTRVFSINISTRQLGGDGGPLTLKVRWECWAKEHAYSSSDPKWMSGHWDLRDVLFGREQHESNVIAEGVCTIPMPEKNYPAVYATAVATWSYTRPLGRLRDRILGRRSRASTWVDVPGGVPVPGKGESDYDCGDDAIFGTGGVTVEDAVANVVRSALRDRERYDGQEMSVPRAE